MKILKWLTIMVIAIPLLITGCIGPAETPTAPKPTPTPTPSPAPQVRLAAKEAYEIALNHATAKYGEIYLSSFEGLRAGYATIYRGRPRYLAEGRSDEWKITFNKPTEPQEYISIYVTVKNGEVTRISESKPLSFSSGTWADQLPYLTIDVEKWNIDSPEAVKIAEEAGGAEFTLLMLSLISSREYPKWRGIFGPSTTEKGEHPGLAVEINATNGEVIKTETKTFKVF